MVKRYVIDVERTSMCLKEERIAHGYTVGELQYLLGLSSPQCIYNWESLKIRNIPALEHFHMLSELYGVPITDLYAVKEVPPVGNFKTAREEPVSGLYASVLYELESSRTYLECMA